jgi:L-ribulose-5-phosphate 3-epimerase
MSPIGIMQGRLSPPVDGLIQSFPVHTWREEFGRARDAGLACIEWIYEAGTDAANPLGTDDGIAEIRRLADAYGVAVRSVCADYYMAKRLVDCDGATQREVVAHLQWLIERAGKLGVRYIVLPFVDSSSLRSEPEINGLLSVLKSIMASLGKAGVELHLETDLLPMALTAILQAIDHPLVRANYDIGNSASLGYDPAEELSLLGPWLGSVHVKDRMRGGTTVSLGTGAADFSTCFRMIDAAGFKGPFILQAAREVGLSETELAKRNRKFVEEKFLVLRSG